MCAAIGLNVSADGAVSVGEIRQLGATWVRIVATPEHALRPYLTDLQMAGIRVLMVLARESFDGTDGAVLSRYASRYGDLVTAWQCGNEPDIDSPSSWTMNQYELASLGREVRAAMPHAVLVCAGLASGNPSWLRGMDLSPFDAIAAHLYLKDATPGNDLTDVWEMVEEYRSFGKPLILSEWGYWSDEEPRASEEVADMVGWAANATEIEALFYFCHSDRMVPPFGLLDADGNWKPRALAFQRAAVDAVEMGWPHVTPVPEPPPSNRVTELMDRIEADLRELRTLVS